jgi:environmental stress-induced protein Ves
MRRLTPADYRVMPWRNGGGTTTEIVISPEGSALGDGRFLYRVSIADVSSDGPFSRFDGCDRHIMLLDGAGMTLDCGAHGRIELVTPCEPRSFSGDWDVQGTLAGGPVRDFNLIVDRARAASSLDVLTLDAPTSIGVEPSSLCILHVIAGSLTVADAGDTLVTDAPFELSPRGSARIALARVEPRMSR